MIVTAGQMESRTHCRKGMSRGIVTFSNLGN